ncbi:MAG: hypothetical protein JSW59_02705, partial [Phycisphaerales bacterium]
SWCQIVVYLATDLIGPALVKNVLVKQTNSLPRKRAGREIAVASMRWGVMSKWLPGSGVSLLSIPR